MSGTAKLALVLDKDGKVTSVAPSAVFGNLARRHRLHLRAFPDGPPRSAERPSVP